MVAELARDAIAVAVNLVVYYLLLWTAFTGQYDREREKILNAKYQPVKVCEKSAAGRRRAEKRGNRRRCSVLLCYAVKYSAPSVTLLMGCGR